MEKPKSVIVGAFNFLGGLGGLISICLLVWRGGALVQTVNDHGRRIDNIELGGSIGLREHVKLDDERVADIKLQTARLTNITDKQTDALADIRVIKSTMDSMQRQLDSLLQARNRTP